jgi:hypothetical protein
MIDYLEKTKPNFSKKIKDLFMLSKIKSDNKHVIEIRLFNNLQIKFEEDILQTLREKITEIKTEESDIVVYYDGGCNIKSNALVNI